MKAIKDFKCSIHAVLVAIVLANCVALLIVGSNVATTHSPRRQLSAEEPIPEDGIYRFEDPTTASQVLQQLDIFNQIETTEEKLATKYSGYYLNLIPDSNYCKKHREYIVEHPEVIFEQKNIITSLIKGSLLRKRVIPAVGVDIQPKVGGAKKEERFDLSPAANSFFTFFGMQGHRALGIQYSCLSQVSNAIPGHGSLYRKDYISENMVAYSESYEDQPECFNHDKFFPKTWILYEKEQCESFFKHFNSKEYKQLKKERGEIVYMRKIGANAHQGRGVFPMNTKEEEHVNKIYDHGKLCGTNKDNNIIQYFVYNPLLLYGHKFDFRIYMLIASSNPLISYYHDGFLRVSLHNYSPDSKEKGALLTNTALSKNFFNIANKEGTYDGMTAAELKDFHLWNFQRLENYLYETGVVTDRNWLENYLRPEFRKALAHLVRMSQHNFSKFSSNYHLFGMDFMLDANLNLWFIEANAAPALEGFSVEMKDLVSSMLADHFEIVFGLMKSRMKRVINYVNKIIREGEVERISSSEVVIRDLDLKREEFEKIAKNSFEPEFEPSPSNKFQPIINENYHGAARYSGLIKEECI